MNRRLWIITIVVSISFISSVVLADMAELKDQFISPPDSAKPHTWWHWMNDNVAAEGITADLEAMAEVGIGGAQIFNVAEHVPVGTVDYMSDEWLEMVNHAVKEAKRVGIKICIQNCAGWSNSGGPWITPEYSMKILTISETLITGPQAVTVTLPQPEARLNFYRDIIVLAFPTPQDNNYRLSSISVKAGFESQYGVDLDLTEAPAAAIISSDTIIDITSHMDANGGLTWDCPEGNWTILRIGCTTTGKTNHPASDSGVGLECDKLSRAAMDVHWQNGIQPILDKIGNLAGPIMNNLLIDSYEVGCNNWTADFAQQFQQLRGYDLKRYLPVLTGRVVNNAGVSERFLWDYRRTISDLFASNYFGYFADKCHDAGLLCSIEPYDGPFECLSIAPKADIIMGEFWTGVNLHVMDKSLRIAASVSHTHGQNIVGAESFTAAPKNSAWMNYPRSMKALGDDVWCNGINRYIFHTSTHQPWLDQRPGMTMGMYGTNFERTNTWWKDGAAWMKYIARSQFLLQSGRFHADLLFFGGEFVPNSTVYRPDLKAKGYDYDTIGTDLFSSLSIVDGQISLPGGMRYKLLVMPETETMSLAVAQKVQELVEGGATVLSTKPQRVPSLTGYPNTEAQLRSIADEVWGSGTRIDHTYGQGRILSGYSVEETLARINLNPDFQVLSENRQMNYIHRIINGSDVYFVSNQENTSDAIGCSFRVTGKVPELWSSQYGTITPATLWRRTDDRTEVTLQLNPEESVFVVFNEVINLPQDSYVSIERQGGSPIPVNSPSKLEIVKAEYGDFSLKVDHSVDVTDVLNSFIENDRLSVLASNALAGDPAYGVSKDLWVDYSYDNSVSTVRISENHVLQLPLPGSPSGKTLHINKAIYGDIPAELSRIPAPAIIDITKNVRSQVQGNSLQVIANTKLAGSDPAPFIHKKMRLVYRLDGVEKIAVIEESDFVKIPDFWQPVPWPATICQVNGKYSLLAWDDGDYHLKKASGDESVVSVPSAVMPVRLDGSWNLQFTNAVRPPESNVLSTLKSLSDHPDKNVREFSGTVIYQKQITVNDEWLAADRRVVLDLGRVEVMARVIINGNDLGVLWKNPYRVDITDVLQAGDNQIEIRVTNLWANRLIGDEAYPDDCTWAGAELAEWPQWLLDGTPRPSQQRQTFATWKHWNKGESLLPSGLIGPVYVRIGQEWPINLH